MKRIVLASAALLLMAPSPVMAMSCCGGGKDKGAMMCGKPGMKTGMAMNHGAIKGKKGGCCCEGMPMNMTKRG
ncbi:MULTISPECIES: hypothetical protein [Methylobacteriaceae]|jgi:hypothetical protein|uniref:Uncharacterized protein n=3 Tax=Methylobacterium TaxID=407 RepID=A0A512J193_9HYPH|nr:MULTISPECIES: hypothetical protein [Methylobacterium]MBY0294981.1 hypothetical protein [Methylobacterium sp.]MDN3621701.1 hypothetical protein [Methylobacterium isbiliense]GEP03731.1 hypothetical protein MOX02_17690 [Methylobacterium oxalidis]GJE00655.1 hypothetical protein GMJLKIPL_2579 [Methylobacterium isbiliense]GJE33665.1 hypothetical protein LDDCCGHA_3866 [Methylobacterium oxalidis]